MKFSGEHQLDISKGVITFIGYDGAKRVVNYISEEAVEDFFGAAEGDHDDLVEAFRRKQQDIQNLAEIAIAQGQTTESGGARITSEWLRASGYHEI